MGLNNYILKYKLDHKCQDKLGVYFYPTIMETILPQRLKLYGSCIYVYIYIYEYTRIY